MFYTIFNGLYSARKVRFDFVQYTWSYFKSSFVHISFFLSCVAFLASALDLNLKYLNRFILLRLVTPCLIKLLNIVIKQCDWFLKLLGVIMIPEYSHKTMWLFFKILKYSYKTAWLVFKILKYGHKTLWLVVSSWWCQIHCTQSLSLNVYYEIRKHLCLVFKQSLWMPVNKHTFCNIFRSSQRRFQNYLNFIFVNFEQVSIN